MAKKWYPVIDILTCLECGTCVEKCTHGVYEKNKAPIPVVVNSDNCIDHCHGCGNLCPVGAISYVGDDTDWIAPAFNGQEAVETSCGCSCAPDKKEKEAKIEYLFLDLNTCDRCVGTDGVLDEVMKMLRPVLEVAGFRVIYQKQEISDVQLAKKYRFRSSPTILVNGQDIFETITESDCGCCGDIAGVQVDCRVFEYDGKTYEVPTKEMLMDGILKVLYNPVDCCCEDYQLPKNLKRFFEGKERKSTSACCCGSASNVDEASLCCCSKSVIKVLGAGCENCHDLFEASKAAVGNMGLSVDVEYVTDMEKIMEYGVMSMPALVVNEKVVSIGKVLKASDVEKLLRKVGF